MDSFSWETPEAVSITVDLIRHPVLRAPLEKALAMPLPEAGFASLGTATMLWQGPNDWLILGCRAAGLAALVETFQDAPVLINSIGDGRGIFTLVDPEARTLLASGTGLDLHHDHFRDGAVAITRFAQVRATIYRDGATWQLIVERQFARHVSAWLSHAALTNGPPARKAL
jgi:sarcosine oxidase subunit gamma